MKPYFHFDLDFFNDQKILKINKKCGNLGLLILIRLLTKIYSNSYYITWDKEDSNLFSEETKIDINLINKTIITAVDNKFFNIDIFKKYNILTSKSIQNRYATKNIEEGNAISIINKIALIKTNNLFINYIEEDIKVVDKSFYDLQNDFCISVNFKNVTNIDTIEENESTKVIEILWAKTFQRTVPGTYFYDKTKVLIDEHGYEKVEKVFYEGWKKNFRNFHNFFDLIIKDPEGNLKIKDRYPNGNDSTSNGTSNYNSRANYKFDPNSIK